MNPHHAALPPTSSIFTLDLGEAPPDGPGGLGGHPVDPPVEEDHDSHGGEEWADCTVEDVSRVTWEDALGGAVVSDHPPTVQLSTCTTVAETMTIQA